jgi:glycine dehydrogenase subunit 1
MVTAATIYMSLLGYEGLARVAAQSQQNTRRLVDGLCGLDGIERLFEGPYFHEVAVSLDRPVGPVLEALAERGILGGIEISRGAAKSPQALLVCATETKTDEDIDAYVATMRDILNTQSLRSA